MKRITLEHCARPLAMTAAAIAARWAGLALALCGAGFAQASARYECEWVDGTVRKLARDVSLSFPDMVKRCTAIDGFVVDPPHLPDRSVLPVRLIVATSSAALPLMRAPPPPVTTAFLRQLINRAARRHGMDPKLVEAVIQVESAFSIHARSPKGALGLMQLMPATAARFGANRTETLFDPEVNIDVGVRYLRVLSDMFGQRHELFLAAYNAGEGAVVRYGYRVPPYRETREYVRKILELYRPTG